jgi:hypothetical protein
VAVGCVQGNRRELFFLAPTSSSSFNMWLLRKCVCLYSGVAKIEFF